MAAYLARIFQHFHKPSAQPVAHKCHRQHSLKYRRFPGCSSLPFAGKIYWSHLSCPVSQQGSLGYKQRGLSKELLSIQPDQGCQQGSIRAKCFLWLVLRSLEWTQPILSYYFREKSAVSPDQVLEKSVQHFRVLVLF